MVERKFNEIKKFVHTLKLNNVAEWREYIKSDKKPNNIPAYPDHIYKNKGWKGFGDFLGTGRGSRLSFLPFNEARNVVRALGLQDGKEWSKYCKSGKKPNNIPSAPRSTYGNQFKSMGDWLGTGSVASFNRNFKSFNDARKFVHSLKLKNSEEWNNYCNSGKKPDDIPAAPQSVFKKDYTNMGDWLGTFHLPNRQRNFLSYSKAKKYVQTLNLKSHTQWKQFYKSKDRPDNIPSNPKLVYKKDWQGWDDWLGKKTIRVSYKSFDDAREYVRKLNLKNVAEWRIFTKSSKKPYDLPTTPETFYKNKGWKSYGDWLGTEFVATQQREYTTFTKAKEFAHSLKFKNQKEWFAYCKSEKKPKYIHTVPNEFYKKEWVSWGDFLGTGNIASIKMNFRPFKEARKFVRSLGLKNYEEWKEYCKSGKKPDDIPAGPAKVYSKKRKK